MATLKQIRARIRSVRSTQQITKAMEMVAAAKLRRSQERVIAARPYAGGISRMLENLAAASENMTLDPESTAARLFEVRPVERRVLVVMASDKGLCGSFNMNVFRSAERHLDGQDRSRVALVAIGRRTVQYFSKRGWTLHPASGEMGDQADLMKARTLALELIRTYKERETDGVELLYTQFISTMSRRVRLEPLLPVTPPAQAGAPPGGAAGAARPAAHDAVATGTGGARVDYIFEPSTKQIFDELLPRYVENRVLQAMAESLASEHSARMISMGAATKNASEVIDHLTLVRNRLRQAAITREINEIVGGANAIQ